MCACLYIYIYIYKLNTFTFGWLYKVFPYKFLKYHNFTHNYSNIWLKLNSIFKYIFYRILFIKIVRGLCVVVVHSSLGQRLIRHEWETSLPNVGLNKSLRTKVQCHFQRGQYLIGGRDESPPTKRRLLGFKGKPPLSPSVGSCVTRRSALP